MFLETGQLYRHQVKAKLTLKKASQKDFCPIGVYTGQARIISGLLGYFYQGHHNHYRPPGLPHTHTRPSI